MTKTSKKPKKSAYPPKSKRATNRPFPYEKVAKPWALKKTIPEIAKASGQVGKGDDPYLSLRVALTKMHKGYKDKSGKIVKLAHRVSQQTVNGATKTGRKASA